MSDRNSDRRVPRLPRGAVLMAIGALALLIGAATPAPAQSPLADDTQLKSIVKDYVKNWDKAPGATSAPGVVIYEDFEVVVKVGKHTIYWDLIVRVNDPIGIEPYLDSRFLGRRAKLSNGAAFMMRGDVLTRATDTEILQGDNKVVRARIDADFGDLKAGDVVGWSVVGTFDQPMYFNTVPAGDRIPVAYKKLHVKSSGRHTYAFKPRNLSQNQFKLQVQGKSNGRDSEWVVEFRNVAAREKLPVGPPYSGHEPLVMIAQSETYLKTPVEGWLPTFSWTRVALWTANFREAGLVEMIGINEYVDRAVGGATGAQKKTEAVFQWVQALPVFEGDRYDQRGFRTIPEMLKAQQVTRMEQAMIMVGLLDAIGIDAELGVAQRADWAPLDQETKSFVQFQEVVVRIETTGKPAYFAPYAGAPLGGLPPEWGTCTVITPANNLIQNAAATNMQVMNSGMTDLQAIADEVQKRARAEKWVHIETVEGRSVAPVAF